MGGFSLKASPQNAAGTDILPYVKFYPAAFSIGGEKKALRRSALIQGKAIAYSLNYHRFSSRNQQHRREGVSDKEKRLFIAGSILQRM